MGQLGCSWLQMATGNGHRQQPPATGISKQQDRGARDSEGRADGDQETRLLPEAHWPHIPHDQLPHSGCPAHFLFVVTVSHVKPDSNVDTAMKP